MKLRLIAISIVSLGCSSHETKSEPTTSITNAGSGSVAATSPSPGSAAGSASPKPPPAAAGKPSSLPPELAPHAGPGAVQAGPFPWPKGGTSAIVDDATEGLARVIWHSAAGSGEDPLPRSAATVRVMDVTKDGEAELVIFAKPTATKPESFEDPTMTWIVGVDPKSKKPQRMWRLENQVLGATDDASLTRELQTIGRFDLAAGSSPIRIIARLPDATPAELQALVGKAGLKLCHRQAEKKKCKTITQKAIDAKLAKKIVESGGVIGAYEPDPSATESPEVLQPPSCAPDEKNPQWVTCSASIGGPAGGQWVFEKTSGGLRLAEVWSWAEDS